MPKFGNFRGKLVKFRVQKGHFLVVTQCPSTVVYKSNHRVFKITILLAIASKALKSNDGHNYKLTFLLASTLSDLNISDFRRSSGTGSYRVTATP